MTIGSLAHFWEALLEIGMTARVSMHGGRHESMNAHRQGQDHSIALGVVKSRIRVVFFRWPAPENSGVCDAAFGKIERWPPGSESSYRSRCVGVAVGHLPPELLAQLFISKKQLGMPRLPGARDFRAR